MTAGANSVHLDTNGRLLCAGTLPGCSAWALRLGTGDMAWKRPISALKSTWAVGETDNRTGHRDEVA